MAASCSDMSTSTASSRPRRMPHTSRSSPSAVTLPASALQAWQAVCSVCALVFQADFATGGSDHRARLRCASKVQCRVTDVTHQLGGNTIRHIPTSVQQAIKTKAHSSVALSISASATAAGASQKSACHPKSK